MMTELAWTEFLRAAHRGDHGVQIYRDVGELAESVAAYLAVGFEAGDPGVLIATPEHRTAFEAALGSRGWTAAAAEQQGLLTVADAAATLAAFMDDDRPSAERFERVVGGLLDSVTARYPERRIRAFGEMVDVLCLSGQPEAAHALEDLWNELARMRSFALLCGYRLDVFDRAAQVTALPGVCRTHSHVLPALDSARLTLAVDRALQEVLGPGEAANVYLQISEETRRDRVSAAQLALMWVSAHMPMLADRILASARAHYERPALVPSA